MMRAIFMGLACSVASPAFAAEPPEVVVYAAASLRDALQQIAPACEKAAGLHLVFNFGGSNDLARQIVAANKADLFISADDYWMDRVAGHGLLDAQSRGPLLSNRLVVVVPPEATTTIDEAADLSAPTIRRISLANPEAVPAGKYAKTWLESIQLWEAVKGKVVPAVDVRAALASVEAGAVDAGIVYRTDAAISKKARIAWEVPESEGPRIAYPAAALVDRPGHESALRALECLSGEESKRIFERFGFIVARPSR